MEQVTSLLQTFSAWATSIAVIAAALSPVCKPVRDLLKWMFKKVSNNDGNEQVIKEIKAMETNVNNRMDDMSKRIDAVSAKNDENERDRLKHVIFQYGNYSRKQQAISGEEFRYVQECFEKYTALGGNGIAHTEMEFITDYYNHQHWGKN